jgi:hypothetical protein
MNRKAFRCGALALLLAVALALPAISAPATAGSRSSHPAVERGFVGGLWEHLVELVAGAGPRDPIGGLAHLLGANRGGIDPNGLPLDPAPTDPSSGDGDNRGGIDPNG